MPYSLALFWTSSLLALTSALNSVESPPVIMVSLPVVSLKRMLANMLRCMTSDLVSRLLPALSSRRKVLLTKSHMK